MSQTCDNLMKKLYFIMRASRYFMFENKQPISGQKRVLAVLKLEDGLTQNYLAEVLALQPGSLAELLKKMEVKGYIKRETDNQDKRVKRVFLTSEGKAEAGRLKELERAQDTAPFFAGLSENEQQEFGQYLEKIADGWDENLKQQAQKFVDPAFRMKAISQWRKYAAQHNLSRAESNNMCRRMQKWNHFANYQDFKHDKNRRYCQFNEMPEYNADFWHRFWHNDEEER
ncbi:MarR family winged helix-turn-helix transcriptional regulator [Lactobacillus sp. ESL0225]|uniref:MarR family winged helix-turn-helix transcriptional regulator n=1 Tax=Lactobacillus sp. ESL0225 TaxID=2069351 RepID=UPI000EFBE30A|nr:MarR family transcriptional regulator [Lactobacillus sp. ESL0225]RMC51146.1 MarR family transcriptional regulator [Lactobacillus sp. ESL0225]